MNTDRTTPIGGSIDNYLKGETQVEDHVIHLLFAANRWEAAAGIRESIVRGITVVVDRYSYSGAVYSAAKHNPSLSLEWAWQQEIGLPQPDMCIFLDIDTEAAEQRGGFGTERYETQKMQNNVKELFQQLRALPCGDVIWQVNAGRSLEEVEQDVLTTVMARCLDSESLRLPLRSLRGMATSGKA